MSETLTLEQAMNVKPGDKITFSPDMDNGAIASQVRGIPGLTDGMNLTPGQEYIVKLTYVERRRRVTGFDPSGLPPPPFEGGPPSNVVFTLENGKSSGYTWFK